MGNLHENIRVLIQLPVSQAIHKECLTETYSPLGVKYETRDQTAFGLFIYLFTYLETKFDPKTFVFTEAVHIFTEERTPHRVSHVPFSVTSVTASHRTHSMSTIKKKQPLNTVRGFFNENRIKYTDEQCEQYTEFLNAAGDKYSYHWASKG